VAAYYAADYAAGKMYERVRDGDASGVASVEIDGVLYYNYTVRIDEHQLLDVSLRDTDGTITVERWKIIDSGEWTPDDGFGVWDGE
jgi:hypothetical protein